MFSVLRVLDESVGMHLLHELAKNGVELWNLLLGDLVGGAVVAPGGDEGGVRWD